MKSSRFSEEQIIGILKQAHADMKIIDLCRTHGSQARGVFLCVNLKPGIILYPL